MYTSIQPRGVYCRYAHNNGVRYADYAITSAHTFETYGTFEIEDVIDLVRLREEHSRYVVDGAINLKVFVRPIAFQKDGASG